MTKIKSTAIPIPIGLYIHYPWCISKCGYCDFNSHPISAVQEEAVFLEALIEDFHSSSADLQGRTLSSVYFGGGTPSLLSVAGVERLMALLRPFLSAQAEISLEANPATVDTTKFAGFRAAGVTRLSLGIQSFADDKLAVLERAHSAKEAHKACTHALEHFDNVNFDLMVGLPNQTQAQAMLDVRTAVQYVPRHLSCYELTIEPHTAFHRNPPILPATDYRAEMLEMIESSLSGFGYERYEVSAYARDQSYCQHNINYWNFGDYLGIGPGAHSKLTEDGKVLRAIRRSHPKDYLKCAQSERIMEQKIVAQNDIAIEFLMNALRLKAGFSFALFASRTGLDPVVLAEGIAEASAEGLLEADALGAWASPRGRALLNTLLLKFMS